MPDRIAIFIDGGYLDKVLQLEFNRARIRYELLSEWMANGIDILRTYYYNCLPYKGNPPTPQQSSQFSNAQSFHNSLNRLSRYQVREEKLELRGTDSAGKNIYQQKRVDLMLGIDVVMSALKHKITHAAILSGDSDFLPAVEIAKGEGVIIWLFHSACIDSTNCINLRPHSELWEFADERFIITQAIINSILR